MAQSSTSRELISRSPDLRRLVDDGYEVEIVAGHLVLHRIPYVTHERSIRYGALVTGVSMRAGALVPPSDHTAYFCGDYPCDDSGNPIEAIRNSTLDEELATGLRVNFLFSARPPDGYRDFHHKMTHYAQVISRYARRIDPAATPRSGSILLREDPSDPFLYMETATSRAGLTKLNQTLSTDKVGIVGLGGTGSYILDYVSKTRVAEIHLFDGDDFLQHNAFRSPGATSTQEIMNRHNKAQFFADRYSQMRTGILPHPDHVTPETVPKLTQLDFVFISIDNNETRRWLIPALHTAGVGFIDVGMGLERTRGKLLGILRTSIGTKESGFYVPQMRKIRSNGGDDENGEYHRNMQIVELNALNAALAVIRWKKIRGLYLDLEGELQSTYTLDGNHIINSRNHAGGVAA